VASEYLFLFWNGAAFRGRVQDGMKIDTCEWLVDTWLFWEESPDKTNHTWCFLINRTKSA
jgi:hypothetical protein